MAAGWEAGRLNLSDKGRLDMDLNDELKRQLQLKDEALHRKNLELDALHFVWCSGGCDGGVHRWVDEKLTEEIVVEAERNTKRLREYWENSKRKRQKEGLS